MKSFRLLVSLVALSGAACSYAAAKIETLVAGPADKGGTYIISPQGGRIAWAGPKGTRLTVMVDGVEGPQLDELYNPHGSSFFSPPNYNAITASAGGQSNAAAQPAPVIMSPDGSHWAYAGRQGEEYVVIHDGQEVGRGPRQTLRFDYGPLTLSPGGKHVYWREISPPGGARQQFRLLLDGKPTPWSSHHNTEPIFSPDEKRYAYNFASPDDTTKMLLMVDGEVADYQGRQPIFSAGGKHLITIDASSSGGSKGVLVDGELMLETRGVRKLVMIPGGDSFAAIAFKESQAGGSYMLFIDGEEIPGTEDVKEVWFSTDGKHYAAACENKAARSMFMVVDGNRQREYQAINTNLAPLWFANSSRLIYTVTAGGGRPFVVVDDQEQQIGYLSSESLVTRGAHYAYHTYDGSNTKHSLIIDGQEVLLAGYYPRKFGLNADGTRHAYDVSRIGRSDVAGFVVDGKLVEGFFPTHSFLFSPDGEHLAIGGGYSDRNSIGMYVDGKLLQASQTRFDNLTFTPDSNHLAWLTSEKFPDRPRPYITISIDGERMLKLDKQNMLLVRGSWDMSSEGVLTVIEEDANQVKRFRISPSGDMTIAKWIADADSRRSAAQAEQAALEKEAGEQAAVAKAKAESDQAAAAAQAKADAATAAEKRKADYAAAVEARKKAYAEAVEQKRQARLLQLENAKRARQGLPALESLPAK